MKYLVAFLSLLAVGYLAFLSVYTSAFSAYQVEPSVHPVLQMKGKHAEEARLIKIGDRIHQAFAYDFSNIFFIEGDKGIIVIDSGWSAKATERALQDYRTITTKPIVALIYTHGHSDHLGGARILVDENPDVPVKIYAADSWHKQYAHFNTALAPHVTMRAAAQLGALLPDGNHGRVNIGVGKMQLKNNISVDFVAPTEEISELSNITIEGVRLQLIPMASETIDQMLIWLPEDKVMHAADVAASAVPILSTPRNEPDRSPIGFIDSIELMMDRPVEHLIAGHSLPVLGKDKAREALLVQRDAAQFIYDQTIRALNNNLGPRETAETVQLPDHLANHPILSQTYHRVPWLVRGLYSRYGGWFSGDTADLNPLSKHEEAKRMIVLAGGAEAFLEHTENAFHQGDYQWAAQLASYLLDAKVEEKTAKAIKIAALKGMAYASYSGNQRHYMLTEALTMELGVNPNKARQLPKDVAPLKLLSMKTLLRLMGPNLNPDACPEKTTTLAIHMKNRSEKPNEVHFISLRRSVFHYHKNPVEEPDTQIETERETLEHILANQLSWKDAVNEGKINVIGDTSDLGAFLECFDFYEL
ncbi:alkyl sulfatase dimerization domain-containing protein [Pseudoteredinibacter isoporae]|uniref:Alkyl sulfatase BDS1-like metallo-beta-lactamase superfamily hydrolase n=1 Tax=Pseudoteredinibacter isoporae TaxID=570281 RepID=A0A7X0JRP7_9GAMM|nr:alkyl sulfatase dimerization domain-containing protein [Pseudoteredinibacter isoporae]MBB6520161.1 alkyl sulfatase BDS1-like metallo-beta-lactamase superfamily hydrolase [Pseudoteredinibacter isoporae]NHO85733.1 MBL fold metallo-hydrolase [Pseudoteredinibacter isoporae]NIB25815.1 MBL fold metallo-hydrolase [Pseudoteredinibacter isoporae]